jgi:hypothetical protein
MSCKELNCELDFITLDFEDGASEECLVAGLYEIEGRKYVSVVLVQQKIQISKMTS